MAPHRHYNNNANTANFAELIDGAVVVRAAAVAMPGGRNDWIDFRGAANIVVNIPNAVIANASNVAVVPAPLPQRPHDIIGASVFNMLREDLVNPNRIASVFFDAEKNALIIQNATLNSNHIAKLFSIVDESNIISLRLDLCRIVQLEIFTSALKIDDTLKSIELLNGGLNTSKSNAFFLDMLKVNSSLTTLISTSDFNIKAESVARLLFEKELQENSQLECVAMAKSIVAHYLAATQPSQPCTSAAAATVKTPTYHPLTSLRCYNNSPEQVLHLKHSIEKLLRKGNAPLEKAEELINDIKTYVDSHSLFEILGLTHNPEAGHAAFGIAEVAHSVLRFLAPGDILYSVAADHDAASTGLTGAAGCASVELE